MERQKDNSKIEARLYKVSPAFFGIFTKEVTMIEHYHLGVGNILASGKIPIIEATNKSSYYEHLKGHFEYVWKINEKYEITKSLVEKLNEVSEESEDGKVSKK